MHRSLKILQELFGTTAHNHNLCCFMQTTMTCDYHLRTDMPALLHKLAFLINSPPQKIKYQKVVANSFVLIIQVPISNPVFDFTTFSCMKNEKTCKCVCVPPLVSLFNIKRQDDIRLHKQISSCKAVGPGHSDYIYGPEIGGGACLWVYMALDGDVSHQLRDRSRHRPTGTKGLMRRKREQKFCIEVCSILSMINIYQHNYIPMMQTIHILFPSSAFNCLRHTLEVSSNSFHGLFYISTP